MMVIKVEPVINYILRLPKRLLVRLLHFEISFLMIFRLKYFMIGFHCYKIEALAPDNRKITSMKVANLPTSRSRNVSFTNT